MRRGLARAAVTTATATGLALGIVALPRDECTASSVGNCVEVGSRAFDTVVDKDTPASLPLGRIALDQVVAGDTVAAWSRGKDPLSAPPGAAYLVVDLTATVKDNARSLRAVLHSDGLELRNTIDEAETPMRTIPGVPVVGRLVFLVPRAVLADDDLSLEITWGSGDAARFELGPVAVGPAVKAQERP